MTNNTTQNAIRMTRIRHVRVLPNGASDSVGIRIIRKWHFRELPNGTSDSDGTQELPQTQSVRITSAIRLPTTEDTMYPYGSDSEILTLASVSNRGLSTAPASSTRLVCRRVAPAMGAKSHEP